MYERISTNPATLNGKPIIRGTRLSVEFVLEYMASSGTIEKFIATYPDVTVEDVEQALNYVSRPVGA